MAQLHESLAALRVVGETLLPDETTALLGAKPSKAFSKGELIARSVAGKTNYAKAGLWLLNASDRQPENVDGQVRELLDQLTGDFKVWATIGARFEVNLSCGWFMEKTNEGLSLSPKTLADLGQRGIELWLDLYAPLGGE